MIGHGWKPITLPRAMIRFRSVLALSLFTVFGAPARADEPALDGNWKLSYALTAESESTGCLIRLETKNGVLTGRVLAFAPPRWETTVERISRDGDQVRLVLQGTAGEQTFEGRLPPQGGSIIPGSYGSERRLNLARLMRTEQTELAKTGLIARRVLP